MICFTGIRTLQKSHKGSFCPEIRYSWVSLVWPNRRRVINTCSLLFNEWACHGPTLVLISRSFDSDVYQLRLQIFSSSFLKKYFILAEGVRCGVSWFEWLLLGNINQMFYFLVFLYVMGPKVLPPIYPWIRLPIGWDTYILFSVWNFLDLFDFE